MEVFNNKVLQTEYSYHHIIILNIALSIIVKYLLMGKKTPTISEKNDEVWHIFFQRFLKIFATLIRHEC